MQDGERHLPSTVSSIYIYMDSRSAVRATKRTFTCCCVVLPFTTTYYPLLLATHRQVDAAIEVLLERRGSVGDRCARSRAAAGPPRGGADVQVGVVEAGLGGIECEVHAIHLF